MSLSETLPELSVPVETQSASSRPTLIDITGGKMYFEKLDDGVPFEEAKEPMIGIDGVDHPIQELLDSIDNDNQNLPETVHVKKYVEDKLEKRFQESLSGVPVDDEELVESFGSELVKKWSLIRVRKYFQPELAQCSPVAAKMLQFKMYFGKRSSRVLKYCSESVSRWAGGSIQETIDGLNYWRNQEKLWSIEEALRTIDYQNAELPEDLQLDNPTYQLLKTTKKNPISKWSQEFIDDLSLKTNLTELEIIRWVNAYKLKHYTLKHGNLSQIQVKVLQFITFSGEFCSKNFKNHLETVCKWAGGSEEEVWASFHMFGRPATAEEATEKWKRIHEAKL